jgi:hypothetical protein
VAGIGLIYFTYKLFLLVAGQRSRRVVSAGLIMAFFMAVNPWHYHFSRIALEAQLATSIMFAGIYMVLKYPDNFKKWMIGLVLLTVSTLTYHANLISIPMILGLYLLMNRKILAKTPKRLLAVGVLIVILIAQLLNVFVGGQSVKASGTSLLTLTNEEKYEKIYAKRDGSPLSSIVHNQYVYFVKEFGKNYIKTWDVRFLLTDGGSHPLFNVPGYGNFYLYEVVFALIGLVFAFLKFDQKKKFILGLILISVVPAAVTKDAVHSVRQYAILPSVMILIGLGVQGMINIIKKKSGQRLFTTTIILIAVIIGGNFMMNYFGEYRKISDEYFHGYMKDISIYMREQSDNYEKIIVTFPFESPYIYYAFYNGLAPDEFFGKIERYEIDNLGFKHVKQLGKIEFVGSTKEVINRPKSEHGDYLVFSRAIDSPASIPMVKFWKNLNDSIEIYAWEDKYFR